MDTFNNWLANILKVYPSALVSLYAPPPAWPLVAPSFKSESLFLSRPEESHQPFLCSPFSVVPLTPLCSAQLALPTSVFCCPLVAASVLCGRLRALSHRRRSSFVAGSKDPGKLNHLPLPLQASGTRKGVVVRGPGQSVQGLRPRCSPLPSYMGS